MMTAATRFGLVKFNLIAFLPEVLSKGVDRLPGGRAG
jgi:hypothetical protein